MTDLSKVYELRNLYNNKVIEKLEDELGNIIYEAWKRLTVKGIPPLILPKCKGVDLIDYKIYGNSVQELLPSEYQQVEYIETTGTQYIKTGLTSNANLSAEIIYEFTTSKGGHILSSNSQYILVHNNASDQWSIGVKYGSEIWTAYGLTAGKKYKTVIDNDISINNEILQSNFSKGNVSTSEDMYLMTWGGRPGNSDYRFIGKMYGCKIYSGLTLVRNFIPCYRKSDNVIGMYDLANNVFYTNAGTETFLKGNDISNEIQSVGRKSSNLLPFPYDYMSRTSRGITYTATRDGLGKIHAEGIHEGNGLSTFLTYYGNTVKALNERLERGKKHYISLTLSKPVPTGLRIYTMAHITRANGSTVYPTDTFTLNEGDNLTTIDFRIYATDGVSREVDIDLYPMLSAITSEFEPYNKYKIPVMSKLKGELDLKDGEYLGNLFKITCKNQIVHKECYKAVTSTWVLGEENFAEYFTSNILEKGTYNWSIHDVKGVAVKNPYIQLRLSSGETVDWNVNTSITLNDTATIIALRTNSTNFYVGNTQQLRIQIEKGETVTQPITTNIYLDEPLKEDEVISCSEDNLPNIPTHKGTTIIEVDTTIQPSNMEVQYYGKGVA